MSAITETKVLDLLTRLVEKSLVVYEEDEQGRGRYRLLESVRHYARDRLPDGEEGDRLRNRHLACYLALAEQAAPHLTGSEQSNWLARLDREHDNLRTAMDWCLSVPEARAAATAAQTPAGERQVLPREAGLRFAGALWRFWDIRSHFHEGRERMAAALARDHGGAPTPERANALNGAAALAYPQGDYGASRTLLEESLDIRRRLGDRRGIARSLSNIGLVAHGMKDYAAARSLQEEALELQRDLGDAWGTALSLENLAVIANTERDYGEARRLTEQSLTLWRQLGDARGLVAALNNLGNAARALGDYPTARACYQENLRILKELGDRGNLADCLEGCAHLAAGEGRNGDAARLLGAADSVRLSYGVAAPPDARDDLARLADVLRAAIGDHAFDAARSEGRAMEVNQTFAPALALLT